MPNAFRSIMVKFGFLICGVAISYAPACSSDSHDDDPTEGVVFDAQTNDEALGKLEAAKVTTDAARGPAFTSPAPNAKLPATPNATFAWKASATALLNLPAGSDFALSLGAPPPRAALFGLPFGAERSALAHGPPLSGRAYLVAFSAGGPAPVFRVFTTATTYAPDSAAWDKLRAATGAITATLTTASFDVNNLAQDSAPITGGPLTFTIER